MSLSADVLCADDRNENSQEAQNFALLVFLSPATKKVRQSPKCQWAKTLRHLSYHSTRLYLHTRFSCRYKALTASYTYRCRSETANIVLIRRMEYRSWDTKVTCSVILYSQIRSEASYEEHSPKRIFDHLLLYSSITMKKLKELILFNSQH